MKIIRRDVSITYPELWNYPSCSIPFLHVAEWTVNGGTCRKYMAVQPGPWKRQIFFFCGNIMVISDFFLRYLKSIHILFSSWWRLIRLEITPITDAHNVYIFSSSFYSMWGHYLFCNQLDQGRISGSSCSGDRSFDWLLFPGYFLTPNLGGGGRIKGEFSAPSRESVRLSPPQLNFTHFNPPKHTSPSPTHLN